jgi:hypothetical protein
MNAVFASLLNPSASCSRAGVPLMGHIFLCAGTSPRNFEVRSKTDAKAAKATVLQRNALIATRRIDPRACADGRPWLVIFKSQLLVCL